MNDLATRLLFLVPFLIVSFAKAAPDYKVEAGAQTYPFGGLLKAQGGYGTLLWQDSSESSDGKPWKYGYVRPYVELQSAGVLNRGIAGLEIYPISIFGVSAGAAISQRSKKDYRDFDCVNAVCDQKLSNQFLQTRLILGYEKVALILTGQYEKFYGENLSRPFYEEMSYLLGSAGGDDLKTLNVLAVFQYDDIWSGGFLGTYQSFLNSRNNNSAGFLILNYTEGSWRGTAGLGEYRSTHQQADYAMVFSIQYAGQKGLGLF